MAKCFDFASKAQDRIIIQNYSVVDTDTGGQETTWANENTVWAIVKPLSGREIFTQGALDSRATHKFTIRYISTYKDTSVTATRRISFDDRLFTIRFSQNMDEEMQNHGSAYQVIYAEENGAEYEG